MDYYFGIDVGILKVKLVLFDIYFNECLVVFVNNFILFFYFGYVE